MGHVPRAVIREYLNKSRDLSNTQRQNMDAELNRELQVLENTKVRTEQNNVKYVCVSITYSHI